MEKALLLLVDADGERLTANVRLLQSADYEVLGAESASDALGTAKARLPDLIVIDAALPDISGIDLIKELRLEPKLAETYVALVFPADSPAHIIARAFDAGADECWTRDMPARELTSRVAAMLRRQQGELTLRQQVQQWRAAVDAIQDAVYIVDLDHRIVECNLALAKLLRRRPSQIIGRRCFELVHGESEPIPGCLHQCVRETGRRESLVVPLRDRWLQVNVDPLYDEQSEWVGTVHVLFDITERLRNEEAQKEQRALIDHQMEELRGALERITEQLHSEMAEREEAEHALSSAHTHLEKQAEDHLSLLNRSQEAVRAAMLEREQALHVREELTRTSAELQSEGEQRQLAEQTLANVRAEWEKQVIELRAMLDKARQEIDQLSADRQQEPWRRLESVSRLAGGLASQYNQLLGNIIGSAEIGLTQLQPSYPAYPQLAEIQRTARRAAELTRELGDMDRRELIQTQRLDLNELIGGLSARLAETLGEGIECLWKPLPRSAQVNGDAHALERALLHLASFAREAMPEGGTWQLSADKVRLDPLPPSANPAAKAGDYVCLSAEDHGTPQQEAMAGLLLEPFAVSGVAPQTSLHLTEVHSIARQHGGWVEATPAGEVGTRFALYLPLAGAK